MFSILELERPFREPVLVFSVALFIILLAPLILRKFRIPGIVGLILAGVAIGPNGFNILEKNAAIDLFATIGLLYIMFLAGLEMDMIEFRKNQTRSLIFGLFTFAIPLTIGIPICHFVIGTDWLPSFMLASMFSTHTLVSYPIASRLGITKSDPVVVSIGGTIITDTLVLLILAIIVGYAGGHFDQAYWLNMGGSLILLGLAVTVVIPWITKWFFRNLSSEGGALYIYVLAVVFSSAFLAKQAGVEPIIGAFLAGLSLNPLIPHASTLMNRTSFVGNALFIPFFLISVGMIVDLRVFLQGTEALFIACILVITALITKWLAAKVTAKVYKFSKDEGNLLFGLSSSHAAATLAIILVGRTKGILDENALNGTIIVILVSCLVSSFITENAGRKVAVKMTEDPDEDSMLPQRILVPVSHPSSLESLMEFASLARDTTASERIFPLTVVNDEIDSREKVFVNEKLLENAMKKNPGSFMDTPYQIVSRVDINPAWGILRAVKEKVITDIVIGWSAKGTAREILFGTLQEALLDGTDQTLWIIRSTHPLSSNTKIVVLVPPNAWLEVGFRRWIDTIKRIAILIKTKLVFIGDRESLERVSFRVSKMKPEVNSEYKVMESREFIADQLREMKTNEMLFIVHGRAGTLSWSLQQENLAREFTREILPFSVAVVYPEQPRGYEADTLRGLAAGMETSPIRENIQRFSRIRKWMGPGGLSKKQKKS